MAYVQDQDEPLSGLRFYILRCASRILEKILTNLYSNNFRLQTRKKKLLQEFCIYFISLYTEFL